MHKGEGKIQVAVFDFDGTLLQGETLPLLGREWLRQRKSRVRYLLTYARVAPVLIRYKLGLISREEMKHQALCRFNWLLAGMDAGQRQSFFKAAYPFIKQHFHPGVMVELQTARNQGRYCLLLSGAYQDLLDLAAKDLNFDRAWGTPWGKIPDRPFNGAEKLVLLKEKLNHPVDWGQSLSYSDSWSDLEILEAAGCPIAVCPDLNLRRRAEEKNWRIIEAVPPNQHPAARKTNRAVSP